MRVGEDVRSLRLAEAVDIDVSPIPPHPTLSPEERAPRIAEGRHELSAAEFSPSPLGRGWGEGE
jgi:hypothetical protein